MSRETPIEWCDSTVNPVAGCDGCELWTPPDGGPRACYAGTLTERYAGRPGYPNAFLEPKLFPGRMAAAARWSDLSGTKRPGKPWLDGLPRVVFISDMGDALSKSVPFEYLREEVIDVVAGWNHIGMWLTKQPRRMVQFARWLGERGIAWPDNLWPGTSITGPDQLSRAIWIGQVPARVRFLSMEPLLADVDLGVDDTPDRSTRPRGALGCDRCAGYGVRRAPGAPDVNGHEREQACSACEGSGLAIHLVIAGGESGRTARPCALEWIERVVRQARAAGAAPFVKQLGSYVVSEVRAADSAQEMKLVLGETATWPQDRWFWRAGLTDAKGGAIEEFPESLQVREFPAAVRS